jgi:predicted DNA-binding transcriptional regulator AlpA
MSSDVLNSELLTDGGLAELLRVSVRSVQRLAKRSDFPRPLRVGRCRRWPKAEVLAFFRRPEPAGLEAAGS